MAFRRAPRSVGGLGRLASSCRRRRERLSKLVERHGHFLCAPPSQQGQSRSPLGSIRRDSSSSISSSRQHSVGGIGKSSTQATTALLSSPLPLTVPACDWKLENFFGLCASVLLLTSMLAFRGHVLVGAYRACCAGRHGGARNEGVGTCPDEQRVLSLLVA